MAGFAAIFDQTGDQQALQSHFSMFLERVQHYKSLPHPSQVERGQHFAVAKFDTDVSLHPRISYSPDNKSWALAVGTLLYSQQKGDETELAAVLRDYLHRGTGVLQELDGQFGLLIYNAQTQTLQVISEPFGYFSIFYSQQQSRVYISTSALAIAEVVGSPPDEIGCRHFLLYGGVLGERTLWRDVKRLTPATILHITPSRSYQERYWSFSLDEEIYGLSLSDSVERIVEVMDSSLRQSLAPTQTSWLSLTGGFDSRTLAALAHYSQLSFKTYCHGPEDARDVQLAKQISQAMGWDFEYFPLPENWGAMRTEWLEKTAGLVDGQRDILKFSRILREQVIKQNQFPVSLWGYGGEIHRGYYWKQEFLNVGRTNKVNYDRLLNYRVIPSQRPLLANESHWRRELHNNLKTHFQKIGEVVPEWPNTVKLDLIAKDFAYGASGITVSSLAGVQRVITPFDYKAASTTVMSIHHRWRTQDKIFRLILEKISATLAQTDTADGGPAAPMRWQNLPQFLPYWINVGEKLLWRVTRQVTGRTLWKQRDRGPDGTAYPVDIWRRETLAAIDDSNLLNPRQMRTANLYTQPELEKCIAESQLNSFKDEALLGRILALEIVFRKVGAEA